MPQGNGVYKVGDLGLATVVCDNPDVTEGDKRYLPRELLQDDHRALTKCDIFSLGATLYELVTANPIPSDGDSYHSLRDGRFEEMFVPPDLAYLIKQMMHVDPNARPTAHDILRCPRISECLEYPAPKLFDERSYTTISPIAHRADVPLIYSVSPPLFPTHSAAPADERDRAADASR